MGISGAVFEGGGQMSEHWIPGVYSRSINVTSPNGVSAGNLVIMGYSSGGKPQSLLVFGGEQEAKDTLVSGELLDAVRLAFNASNTFIPQRVYAMRVNPGTQSGISLKKSNNAILELKSWDWGAHTNQLKITTENGTGDEYKTVTLSYKGKTESITINKKKSFSIKAVESGTNKIKIDANGVTLTSGTPTVYSFTEYPSIDSLVSAINEDGMFIAESIDTSSDSKTSELDYVTETTVLTSEMTLYSNLQAFITEVKKMNYIGDIKLASGAARDPNLNDVTDVNFSGGTAGDYTALEWSESFEILKTEDIQIIATPNTSSDVRALLSNHCKAMSSVVNRKERTFFVGASIGQSDDDGIAAAKNLNTNLGSYVLDGATVINPETGKNIEVSGGMVACMAAAMESAMAVNTPLTNKEINVIEFTKKRSITNMETLIKAGIMVFNPDPDNSNRNVCIRAMTTYQGDDLISCERSMTREALYMDRDLRQRLSKGVGGINNGSTSDIIQTLKDAASDWATRQYIIPDGSTNVWNIKVRTVGDKIYLTYSRYLTAPRNFIFVTASNHIYTSTQEL